MTMVILMPRPPLHFVKTNVNARSRLSISPIAMGRRCVFGCTLSKTLFPFPKTPWLRQRWLEFTHFEELGVFDSSRLCDRHFTPDSFPNYNSVIAGAASYFSLHQFAVPTVYTVGGGSSHTPKVSNLTLR